MAPATRPPFVRVTLLGAVLALAFCLPARAQDYDADPFNPTIATNAWVMISQAEHAYKIPAGLLHAISLVETGQGIRGWVLPWPYTVGVNSPGKAEFLKQQQALNNLAWLKKLGFVRFDVSADGAGSSNISYVDAMAALNVHPNGSRFTVQARPYGRRFNSADDAVSFTYRMFALGHRNLDIGLMQINWPIHSRHFASIREAFEPAANLRYAVSYLLEHRTADWWGCVGRYHSGTPKYARQYILHVWNMYRRIHRLT
jgi:hypothetical protein